MIAIWMMSAQLDTLGRLKIKVFQNKGHDVTTFVHNVMNEILSSDSNYVADVVMWPKFDNFGISITSIL